MRLAAYASTAALLALTGCGGDDGTGTVRVTAYGESFIEAGIPATEVDDGWAIEFSRFEVSVRDVSVGGATLPDASIVDLSASSAGLGHELGSLSVAAGNHTGSSFALTEIAVEGSATRGAEAKLFSWVLDAPTRYRQCDTTTRVSDGQSATFQITVHADHLFYDSLVSDEPQMLFGALAGADLDADGTVTRAELASAGIGAYDPGNEDVDDLWAWLLAQSRTLGHVDGEGHCHAEAER